MLYEQQAYYIKANSNQSKSKSNKPRGCLPSGKNFFMQTTQGLQGKSNLKISDWQVSNYCIKPFNFFAFQEKIEFA